MALCRTLAQVTLDGSVGAVVHRVGRLGRHGVRKVLALGVEASPGRDQMGVVRRRHY